MRGTLALVGSGEYLPPMEPVDCRLLGRLSGAPRVVCLPTAAGTEGQARVRYWLDLGVSHFQRLGAQVEGVPVIDRATAEDADFAERVRMANFVYLSGGRPTYLYDTLAGTAVWAAILGVLDGGGILAGCSAGAMICGQLATPWDAHPGFNLLPGAAIMPHFDEISDRFASLPKTWLEHGATLVGIDGNTALVVSGPHQDELPAGSSPKIHDIIEPRAGEQILRGALRLQVVGAGGVTIWRSSGPVRYGSGDELSWGY
jgi:cyanophycinase